MPHDLGGASDRSDRDPAADGLGQAGDVGHHPGQPGGAGRAGRQPGLDLIEREQGAVGVKQVLERGEVPGLWVDDPGVHHDRLDDHPGNLAGMLVKQPGHAVDVVEGRDQGQPDERVRDTGAGRRLGRLALRADVAGLRHDGNLDRVVMAVVAALHLDDQVAPGDRPHQVDGVHGGLGARVGEPPQRLAEPRGELVGNRHGVLRRLGEVRAAGDLVPHCPDDRRVAVPGQAHAVPAVQVYVLVAVDVVDLGAAAVAEPDRLRDGDLPARGDPAGQRLARSGGHPPRLRLALGENPFLFGDDEFKVCRQPHGAVLRAGHDAS